MLEVVDINTSSTNLNEIEDLKKGFKKILEPTVKDGSVIIISDFPCVGNIPGKTDFLILLSIKKTPGNYFRAIVNNNKHYVDNFVFLLNKINEENIINVDKQNFYTQKGEFNYIESIKNYTQSFENYFKDFDSVNCYASYYVQTENKINYFNDKVFANLPITADNIIWSVVSQSISRFGNNRIRSFSNELHQTFSQSSLIDFAKNVIDDASNKTRFGILTKKKIDRISTSIKLVDEIYANVGKTISIIKGKAGTGKTLTLTRIIHKHASNKRRVRFLTFNNLLIFDIKQNLRNFGYFNDRRLNIESVHHFFYRISKNIGVSILLSQNRVNEIMEVCEKRIEKVRPIFQSILAKISENSFLDDKVILAEISQKEKNKADYDEFREFTKFMIKCRSLNSFDSIKSDYLNYKRRLVVPEIGNRFFIQDYYKVLEKTLLALTNPELFYNEFNIKDRYDLLALLYKLDKLDDEKVITFEEFNKQMESIDRIANWSKLLIVDEAQDFHILEKEILFKIFGSANLIISSGGTEQLIRHNDLLDWSLSLGRKIPHINFPLYGSSYRQKQNIVSFVNTFSREFGFDLSLKSSAESKGVGKIIIDTRPKEINYLINKTALSEFKINGEVNGCSPYESLMILIPSKKYTGKNVGSSIQINDKDYVKTIEKTSSRKILYLDSFAELDIFPWDGVSEDKGKLRVPFETETRIIHYESCRGLESWTCACMSIDEYFHHKSSTDEAIYYKSDNLHMTEIERREKYAALWCMMAFTRPIDTLYIHIENINTKISQKILEIARNTDGAIIY